MVAGLVEQPLEVFVEAAVVGRAGAGDQEDQRCRFVLLGHAVMQLFHRPEVVGQLGLALWLEVECVVALVDVFIEGQFGAQVRWCRGNGGLERVGQWIAVAGRIDIYRQRGRTQY
ncbi:hypothetical protein D3C84_430430 [compost metagenome]